MNTVDAQYLDLISEILDRGKFKDDRTGTGVRSLFGGQLRFDLNEGFPLLTTKKVHYPGIIHELLWFLKGDSNIRYLKENNIKIWDEWATPSGDLGPIYPVLWTKWAGSVNQISKLIDGIRNNPNSRRHVVSAWNPVDLPDESISPQANVISGKMALAPCHCLFQFYVSGGNLSCHVYQRSCDAPIGLPFNIASYAFFTHMVAEQTGLGVGDLIFSFGDVHIYENCIEQMEEQLTRESKELPRLKIKRRPRSVFDYHSDDFEIIGYNPHPPIKMKVSV